jgi:hypothetical protein
MKQNAETLKTETLKFQRPAPGGVAVTRLYAGISAARHFSISAFQHFSFFP